MPHTYYMEEIMKKNVVVLISLCAMVLSLMFSCSGKSAGKDKTVTLTVLGNAGDLERSYIKKAFARYEEKTGNKLDIQGIPGGNFEQVSLTKFNTGDVPDIFLSFGNTTLRAYNPEKNFVDFSDAKWVSDIIPVSLDQAEFEGKIWGLPHWEASATGFLYNKEIFKKYNIAVPTTQTEFMNACQTLLDNGVTPFFLAFQDVWPILHQIGMDPIFYDTPENLTKINKNEITYADIPQMHGMLQWYKDMADKGFLGKNYTTNVFDYQADALGKDEYAMTLCWDTWLYEQLDKVYPGKADSFGLMPAFMGTAEKGTIEGPNNSLILANKNSPRVKEAIAFINFLAEPENYNEAFRGVATAPVFKRQTTIIVTPQYRQAQKDGTFDRAHRASSTWGNVIGFSQGDHSKAIQEVMLGNMSVDEGLATMDAERIATARSRRTPGF